MMRRSCLTSALAVAAGAACQAMAAKPGIEVHVDLAVDPARAAEMLAIFDKEFRPEATRQPGFIDARMLKLNAAKRGEAPHGANYRYVLVFDTEEQRLAWAATPVHQRIWPRILDTLTNRDYTALLYDRTS